MSGMDRQLRRLIGLFEPRMQEDKSHGRVLPATRSAASAPEVKGWKQSVTPRGGGGLLGGPGRIPPCPSVPGFFLKMLHILFF